MTDSIQISIRMRPLISRELEKKATVHWSSKNSTSIYQIACPSVIFNYDRVFDGNENNERVYSEFCSPIVRSVLNGINGTIFAYGQTASGKTFTMMGKDDGETPGIVHFAIFDIFNDIKKNLEREFLLRVSYMEVYNEIVSDLLCESSDNLKLQDDEFGNLIVCGLSEHIVENADQILSLMQRGGKNRRTGTTCMNQKSSRSHSIFRIVIESRLRNIKNTPVNVSQLDLVDLAGSERACHTKATGKRFRESININVSLLMLSHVINQLNENENYISYRDSKLTRILQNSLGGNSKTAIICTVTPASLEETLSTLKFASRAKCVKNNPKVNEILNEQALMKAYENKIKKLTEELEAIKEANKVEAEETSHIHDMKNIPLLFASNIDNKTQRRMTWGGSSNIDTSEMACKISHDWLKYIEILAKEEIKNNLLSKGQNTVLYMNLFPDVKSCGVPKTLIHASTQTNVCETEVLLENVIFPNAVSHNMFDHKVTNIASYSSCHATLGTCNDIVNFSPLYGDQMKSVFSSQNQKKVLTFIESNIKQNKTLTIIQCENIIKYVRKVLQLFSMKQKYDKNAILETVSFHKEFWFFIIFLKSLFPELLNSSLSFFHKYIPEFLENNIPELLLNNFSVSRIDILKELKYFNSNFYSRKILDKKFANQSKIQDKLERMLSHSCDDDLEVNDSFTDLILMSSTNNQAISTAVNSFDLNKCLAIEDFECLSYITNDEVIKKLKEQIQLQQDTISHLMYQCDIKNKQISILKEKEQIRDQIILSLQDEIALRKDKNKEICKLSVDNLNKTVTGELKENFCHTDKLSINDGAILQPTVKKESLCSILNQRYRCENNYLIHKMKCCVEYNYSKTKSDAVELKLDKMYTVNNDKQNIIIPKRNYLSGCDPLIRTPETNDIILKDVQNETCSPSKRCIAKKFASDAISSQEENLSLQTDNFDFPEINKHFRKLITVNNDDDSNDVISLRNEISHLRTIFFRLIEKNTQNVVFMNKENSGLGHTKNIFYNDNISDFNILQQVLLRVDCFLKNLQKSASVNKDLKQAAEEVISLKIELLDLQKKLQEKDTQLFNANKKLLDLKTSIILLKCICQSSKCGKSKILNYRKYAKNTSLKARHLNPIRTIERLHKIVSELLPFFEKQISFLSIISTELAETEARLLSSLKDLTLDTILNEDSYSDSTHSAINDKKVVQMDAVDLVSSKDSEIERRDLGSMISNIKSNIVKVNKASSHIGKLFECIKSSYRNKIKSLELMHEADKLKWNTKIMGKIEELEEKYEQEITDQENELFGIMSTKLNDMKQKFALAEKEKEQQFKEQMYKIQKEYFEQISALKEEHCKNISELEKKLYKEVEDKKEMQDKLHKSRKSEIMVLKLSSKLKDLKKEEEKIKKLNNFFKQKIKLQLVEIEKLKTQLNECNKEYFSHDANSLSSSENENNSKGQFTKLQTSEPENIQPAVSTGNLCFETDNLTKKFKYELDQKKAKIISLETNNASMVKEIMMLKNRMKNMQQYQCKCSQNLKGSEIPVPPKEGYYSEKEKHPTGMNKKNIDKQKEVPKPAEMWHFSSGDNNQCKKQKTECDTKTKQSVAKEAEVVLDEMGEVQCKQQ